MSFFCLSALVKKKGRLMFGFIPYFILGQFWLTGEGEIARLQGCSCWFVGPVADYGDSKIWLTTGKQENEVLRQFNWLGQSQCWKTGIWVGFLAGGGDLYLYHGVQTGFRAHPLSIQLLLYTWVKRPELDPKFFPLSSVEFQERA